MYASDKYYTPTPAELRYFDFQSPIANTCEIILFITLLILELLFHLASCVTLLGASRFGTIKIKKFIIYGSWQIIKS